MHTLVVETVTHGEIVVMHNGDWSGDVVVEWVQDLTRCSINMPAAVFLSVARKSVANALRTDLINFLEEWQDR